MNLRAFSVEMFISYTAFLEGILKLSLMNFVKVCGSDGVSYDNHCKLHQTACILGQHIVTKRRGSCRSHKSQHSFKRDRDFNILNYRQDKRHLKVHNHQKKAPPSPLQHTHLFPSKYQIIQNLLTTMF